MAWYLGDCGTLHYQYDRSEIPPSVAIIETIDVYEKEAGCESGGLDEPLYRYVDTDALDALVESHAQATITLSIDDYHVRVDTNTIQVTTDEPESQDTG